MRGADQKGHQVPANMFNVRGNNLEGGVSFGSGGEAQAPQHFNYLQPPPPTPRLYQAQPQPQPHFSGNGMWGMGQMGGGGGWPMYSFPPPGHPHNQRNQVYSVGGSQFQNQPLPHPTQVTQVTQSLPTYPNPFHPANLQRQGFSSAFDVPANIQSPNPAQVTSASSQQLGSQSSHLSQIQQQEMQAQSGPATSIDVVSRKRKSDGTLSGIEVHEPEVKNFQKILVGKRRGSAKALPTGVIQRQREPQPQAGTSGTTESEKKWSRYMMEVEHYRRQTCSDENQTRPLVK